MRNIANLLKRVIDQGTYVSSGQVLRFGWLHWDSVCHHLGRTKLLPQAVVEFTCNATSLFILRGNQAARKAAQLVIQDS
jgi:hypothetical protein